MKFVSFISLVREGLKKSYGIWKEEEWLRLRLRSHLYDKSLIRLDISNIFCINPSVMESD